MPDLTPLSANVIECHGTDVVFGHKLWLRLGMLRIVARNLSLQLKNGGRGINNTGAKKKPPRVSFHFTVGVVGPCVRVSVCVCVCLCVTVFIF